MKIIGIGLEPDLIRFLNNNSFQTVNLLTQRDVDDWFSVYKGDVRSKVICIIDYDNLPSFKLRTFGKNFKIIGLSSDWHLRRSETSADRFLCTSVLNCSC